MRTLLSAGIAAVVLGIASPASAQMMCSPAPGASAAGGMMCGGGTTGQTQAPSATPANPQSQAMGGCPCCRNMAMMQPQPGQSTPGMGGMQHMPGMQMPSAPATPAPDAPKQ